MEPVDLESLRTISVLQAGELFGFGRTQTYSRVHAGTFPVPVRKIGNEWRVRVVDLRAFYEAESAASNE
jgi:predicted DNA-binding transcriptional regulator AlpA